jgi:hypothetical protein
MVVTRFVVGAAIVGVLADAACELVANRSAGNALATVRTAKQSASQRVFGITEEAILASQNGLTRLEGRVGDQRSMFAGIGLAAPFQFADVEPIVENSRECRSVEPWLAVAIGVSPPAQVTPSFLRQYEPG